MVGTKYGCIGVGDDSFGGGIMVMMVLLVDNKHIGHSANLVETVVSKKYIVNIQSKLLSIINCTYGIVQFKRLIGFPKPSFFFFLKAKNPF